MVGTHEHHAHIYICDAQLMVYYSLIMLHFGEESQFLFCLEALLHKDLHPVF
jgi:hypothetical protein